MNHSTDSAAYRRDPALTLGIVVALVILGIELVPMDALSGFFGHPSLVDRLGAIPANTTRGATLLAMALPFAAIAWIATLAESLIGAELQPRLSWLSNEGVNGLMTVIAAVLAMALVR